MQPEPLEKVRLRLRPAKKSAPAPQHWFWQINRKIWIKRKSTEQIVLETWKPIFFFWLLVLVLTPMIRRQMRLPPWSGCGCLPTRYVGGCLPPWSGFYPCDLDAYPHDLDDIRVGHGPLSHFLRVAVAVLSHRALLVPCTSNNSSVWRNLNFQTTVHRRENGQICHET